MQQQARLIWATSELACILENVWMVACISACICVCGCIFESCCNKTQLLTANVFSYFFSVMLDIFLFLFWFVHFFLSPLHTTFSSFLISQQQQQRQRRQQQPWRCVRQAAVVDLPIKSYIHGFSSLINTALWTYEAMLCSLKPVFDKKKKSFFLLLYAIYCKLHSCGQNNSNESYFQKLSM